MIKKQLTKSSLLFLIIFISLFKSVYAQGPNTPEASSFEPIDATDMVNLVTGDMTYVLPLLNIPSPEGGYPLTLSYHSGIAIDQESSWVGLGWNVNPGAINRSVSGFPDDWKEAEVSSIVYDNGGEISNHNFSIGVGWGDGKYSVGLYGSYSENKAFGGKNSYNFDGGVYGGVGDIKGNIGSDGIGIKYSSKYNFNLGSHSASGTYSIGLNHSFKTGGTSLSVSGNAKISSTGTSTGGSSKTNFNGSIGISATSYTGSNRGSHNSQYSSAPASDSFSFNASVYLFRINYSYNKIRYWYFDKKAYSGVGTLYAENITNVRNNEIFEDQHGLDTYTANYDQTEESLFSNSIILPAYDFYSVSAQGLAGNISPKIFEYGTLTPKRNAVGHNGISYFIESYNKNPFTRELDNDNIHFYFNNTNDSFLNIDAGLWGSTPSTATSITEVNSPNSTLTSLVNIDGVNYDNYNPVKNRKKSGSFIETYTNQQVISNQNLVYTPQNFERTNPSVPSDGIGAFKITSPDGKTYHYSIPVYQKEKFSRSAKYNEDINNKFYEEYQTSPYATHWLLTAITGSDYVDDGNGTISENDLGYWVTFDYGKWSDGYTWRTPRGNDYKTTPTSKVYEWGAKEIYYLNAIKTRTHTALFVKSDRHDGKSIPDSMNKEFESLTLTVRKCRYDGDTQAWYFNGLGFDSPALGTSTVASTWTIHNVRMNYDRQEHKLLKLDKIIVVKNEELPSNFSYSNPNQTSQSVKCTVNISEKAKIFDRNSNTLWEHGHVPIYSSSWSGEYYSNVLDSGDISYYFPAIYNSSNKVIEFNQNYSLARNTPNTTSSTSGRLTLNKLTYKGKNGVQLLPSYNFQYEDPYRNYNLDNVDDWGYTDNYVKSWNLKKITQPTGANIIVNYEEDDYYSEASSYETIFKDGLKFNFYNHSGKLRFDVENLNSGNANNINFLNFYNSGSQAKVNVWACIKHEYNQWGCQSRDGHVNIQDEYVDVVGVTGTKVTFETTLSGHTHNHNDGLNWLFGRVYSYEMSGLQAKERGHCPELPGGCSERTRHTLYYSINSNKTQLEQDGGGLRVKQLTVNSDGRNYYTKYYYNQDGFDKNKTDANYKSSGITSYAPSKYNKNIKYMAELPPPSVLYNTVTVETNDELNKYYFKTLEPETDGVNEYKIADILSVKKNQNQDGVPINVTSNTSTNTLSKYKYEVKNNFSMLGKLLKKEKYNKSNQLLRKVENNYLPISDISQGLNKETFNSYSSVFRKSNGNNLRDYHLTTSSKVIYPSVIEKVKTVEGGFNVVEEYSKYDFNTGQVLETISEDSKGKRFKTEIIPAYTISEYNSSSGYSMGSKMDNITNKNMLSQEAMSKTYIDDGGVWKETGVGITTWNNHWSYINDNTSIQTPTTASQKIWRKYRSFVWDGDVDGNGIYQGFAGDDDFFNWAINGTQTNDKWKNISTTTTYDHFSMPLEVKDINDNYLITKMCDDDTKVLFTTNSKYFESFNTSFEYGTDYSNYIEAQIQGNSSLKTDEKAHTGKYSFKISSTDNMIGGVMKGGRHRAGKYKMSVWVHKGDDNEYLNARYKFSSSGPKLEFNGEKVFAGDWVQLNHYFERPASDIGGSRIFQIVSASGTIYVDDYRVHPVSSIMKSYVYNEWDELSYVLDKNNLATYYKYDETGRLIETYSEIVDDPENGIVGGFKLSTKNHYNYKN